MAHHMPRREACTRFVAFHYDPGVCDSCGLTGEAHAPEALTTPERTKSLWRTLIRIGGPYNYYAGGVTGDGHAVTQMREHMAQCEPVWAQMHEPYMADEACFNGTFTDG